METKMITIPFDLELAKKIQAGEHPGKTTTRDNRDVRIVCFDALSDYALIVLIKSGNGEYSAMYNEVGKSLFGTDEIELPSDLVLQVPEWTQFKDGDILATKKGGSFILNANGEYKTSYYAGLFFGKILFGCAALEDHIEVITYATEEQKQQLIDALKKSTDPRAKEYLKRFFGIEEKKKCEFEPFNKVLVRNSQKDVWFCNVFSHLSCNKLDFYPFKCIDCGYKFCIPYNEKTKHLLGTTDNWEE